MKKLHKKYRCFYPCDRDGKPIKSELSVNGEYKFDSDDAIIYCGNGECFITKMDNSTLRLVVFSVVKLKNIIQQFVKQKIPIKDKDILDSEGWVDFSYSDMDRVGKIVKAKPQTKTPTGMSDKKNYPYWLRIMRNVSDRYKRELRDLQNKQRKRG